MSKEPNPILDLDNFVGSIVFKKKEGISKSSEIFTLEEQMVNYSNEVLGIKVMSVAIPTNYDPELRKESQQIDWLQKIVKNQYTSAYILALKYREKLKVNIEQKEPYIVTKN